MDEEELDIVDEEDNIIGQDSNVNKINKGFISRNVAIFILDDNKKLVLTKRSPYKRTFPDRYDVSAVGSVKAGESYEDAAKRELKEELNIECDLKFLDKIYNEFKYNNILLKYFTGIFLGNFSGEVNLNDELVELQRLSFEEVENLINENKDFFTPGFLNDFLAVKDKLK